MHFMQRHRHVLLANAAGIAILAAVWMTVVNRGTSTAVAFQDPPDEPISELQRERICRSLSEIGFDVELAGALNLAAAQAESMVTTAKQWYLTNEGAIGTAAVTLAEKRHAWRAALKRRRMGEADQDGEPTVETALAELATAQAAQQTLRTPLRTALAGQMSDSQLALWNVLRSNTSVGLPMDLVALTEGQRESVRDARLAYRAAVAAVEDDQDRADARTALRTAVVNVLSDSQETLIATYHGYVDASTGNMLDAVDTVLVVVVDG